MIYIYALTGSIIAIHLPNEHTSRITNSCNVVAVRTESSSLTESENKHEGLSQCTGVKSRTGGEEMLLESWMRCDGCARVGSNRKQRRESNRP